MVKAMLTLYRAKRAEVCETVGAGAVVFGVAEQWGRGAAVLAAGVALLVKSLALDLGGKAPDGDE